MCRYEGGGVAQIRYSKGSDSNQGSTRLISSDFLNSALESGLAPIRIKELYLAILTSMPLNPGHFFVCLIGIVIVPKMPLLEISLQPERSVVDQYESRFL